MLLQRQGLVATARWLPRLHLIMESVGAHKYVHTVVGIGVLLTAMGFKAIVESMQQVLFACDPMCSCTT